MIGYYIENPFTRFLLEHQYDIDAILHGAFRSDNDRYFLEAWKQKDRNVSYYWLYFSDLTSKDSSGMSHEYERLKENMFTLFTRIDMSQGRREQIEEIDYDSCEQEANYWYSLFCTVFALELMDIGLIYKEGSKISSERVNLLNQFIYSEKDIYVAITKVLVSRITSEEFGDCFSLDDREKILIERIVGPEGENTRCIYQEIGRIGENRTSFRSQGLITGNMPEVLS